jgi:hypothetical protein
MSDSLQKALQEEYVIVREALTMGPNARRTPNADEVIEFIEKDADDAAADLAESIVADAMDSRGFIRGAAFALNMTVRELFDAEEVASPSKT